MTNVFKASAPGSLMILGEHAVLWGSPCLVAAVDQRLTIMLTPRSDDKIILSSFQGKESLDLSNPGQTIKYPFVSAVIQDNKDDIPGGFDLNITSDILNGRGFGSSAAVIIATQAVLHGYANKQLSDDDKILQGQKIVRQVQGYGSGADIAAAVLGGIVHYQSDPIQTYKLDKSIPLTAVFCGYKTPTSHVLQYVEKKRQLNPDLFVKYTNQAKNLVEMASQALKDEDWVQLGKIFNNYQNLMQSFGVEDQATREALNFLQSHETISGAKISGSGLGDCVIGLGKLEKTTKLPYLLESQGMEMFSIDLTFQGLHYERI